MTKSEIIEKLEIIIDQLSNNFPMIIATGVCTAVLVFLILTAIGVALFKCLWRRNEYEEFTTRCDSRTEEVTLVGWNAIYRPPESRHGLKSTNTPYGRIVHPIEFSWGNYYNGRHYGDYTLKV